MPRFQHRLREVSRDAGGSPSAVTELALAGAIDASSYASFEKALAAASDRETPSLVVDFRRVTYINSTGISALIRHHEIHRRRGGQLCLAAVTRSVGTSMQLLGVAELIPFARDLPSAMARTLAAELDPTRAVEGDPLLEREGPPLERLLASRPAPEASRGRVLIVSPRRNRFTNVLEKRLDRRDAVYHLYEDPQAAWRDFERLAPDLLVIDYRADPEGELVSRVKLQKERSLTSVLHLYETAAEVERSLDFKIWENDYLVEPFPVLEFFALAETEIARVPRDRKIYAQQVRFEFRTRPENVQKAHRLGELVVRQAMDDAEEAAALFAAVKEGIDNAVIHGNQKDEHRTVDVSILVEERKVTIEIRDQGEGFDFEFYLSRLRHEDAFEEAKRRILEENVRGGLGILLMSRCSDRMEYSGGGNILRLEKDLG